MGRTIVLSLVRIANDRGLVLRRINEIVRARTIMEE